MKIFVVVPIFNDSERAKVTIGHVLEKTKRKVIAVNDGSADGTQEMLEKNFGNSDRVIILKHEFNYGKGAAMRTGVEEAWRRGGEGVIFIDADGQHDPELLPVFEKKLKNNSLVFGYREIDGRMPFLRRQFNHLVRQTVKFLFGIKKKDLFCGYLAMRRNVYKKVKWSSNRYGIETEMATKVGKQGLVFKEVKIETKYLGKKHGIKWYDGVKILLKIPEWYFAKKEL